MDSVFGIPMNWILVVLLAIMFICILSVALIAVFNPVIFKMALRNPPRRKIQSVLIVFGLMLATLIVSAALTTGDTLDYSISNTAYDNLGEVDQTISFVGEAGGEGSMSLNNEPIPASLAGDLSEQFADNPDIEGFTPVLTAGVPAVNDESQLSEPNVTLTGLEFDQIDEFGGIESVDGGQVDLSSVGPGEAIVSQTLAENLRAEAGDEITIYVENQPYPVTIAAVGEDSVLTGLTFGAQQGPSNHGLTLRLDEVQEMTDLDGMARYIAVTNTGGVRDSLEHSEDAEAALEAGLAGTQLGVNPVKRQTVEIAEFIGSTFMSLFLVLGLFSIAAGVLLIFLIFMMLASERRSEMGMARAVGMRQRHLVQQFLAEGTIYDLGAALVGALLGVGVAFLMVQILRGLVGGELFTLTPTFTLRSLAVAYALGVTVTFITIIFASVRAARLNIVSAIRDLPDMPSERKQFPRFRWWWKIPRFGPKLPGIGMYLVSLILFPIELIPNLIAYPFRFAIWLVRVLAYFTGWGPLLLPLGILFMLLGWQLGGQSGSMALYTTGLSVVGFGLMLILRRFLPTRPVVSVISFLLLVWWLSPEDTLAFTMPDNLVGDFDMFFISGIMMVTFAVLLIMWNAEVIVWLISLFGKLFSKWVPAVKTAVAYPLASKVKTGLTMAMFSLIVFSLVTMSTINANFVELFTTEAATGGWDIQVQTNPSNPVDDLREELSGSDVDVSEFQAVGRISAVTMENSQVRTADSEDWSRTFLNGVNPEYAEQTDMPLQARAAGYESDEAVWDAIASDPSVAVVDAFTAAPASGQIGGNPDQFRLAGLSETGEAMEPVEVVLGNPGSGESRTVNVIGVISDEISMAFGIYMSDEVISGLYQNPDLANIYVQLADDSLEHSEEVARDIEAALVQSGVQAESTESQLQQNAEIQTGFLDLIQGFMGLGLLVGIAALGVISFRAVVERRQQIGMLRAIGYQRNMVAASFLIEALVIAVLGVLSGMILALILSYNLINSGEFTQGADFSGFVIPWAQIGLVLGVALVAAVLMTIIPARSAASVPVAEALRYE